MSVRGPFDKVTFSDNTKVRADELNGKHVGQTIRVMVNDQDTGVQKIFTGRLSKVIHEGDQVLLHLGKQHAREVLACHLKLEQPTLINPDTFKVNDIMELRS